MATSTSSMKSHEENLKSKAQEAADTAKQFGEKAKDAACNVADKARDAVSSVADKAKDAAGNFVDRTKETASAFGQQAEDATHAVGRGIGSLAGTVRENLPKNGVIGSAASSLASGLESTGHYLEKENLEGMGQDVMNLIRRNPLPALLLGIGLGYVIARATGSRNG
jgi:gas vesicle protein